MPVDMTLERLKAVGRRKDGGEEEVQVSRSHRD